MKTTDRPIFRPEAVRRYIEGKDGAVLPKLVSPKVSISLWMLVALLILGTLMVWFTKTPVYASALAITVDHRGVPTEAAQLRDHVVLLLLLAPEAQPTLAEGNQVLIHLGTVGKPLQREVVIFEASEAEVTRVLDTFGLSRHPAVLAAQPAAVAFVPLEPAPGNAPATNFIGTVFRAELQIGSRRVASLIPVVDRLL